MIIRMNGATHLAAVVIRFAEGDPEESIIGQGSREEMEELAQLLPAVAYSGDRKTVGAEVVVVPWSEVAP
jgi:hypothetical protein